MSSDSNKENTKAISIKDGNFQWDDNQIKIQSLLNTSKIQGLVQIDSAPNISSFNLYIGKNTSFFKILKSY